MNEVSGVARFFKFGRGAGDESDPTIEKKIFSKLLSGHFHFPLPPYEKPSYATDLIHFVYDYILEINKVSVLGYSGT